MVVWDQIILEDPEEAVFEKFEVKNEYPLSDMELGFKWVYTNNDGIVILNCSFNDRSKNVTIALQWEVIPYFGFMHPMRASKTFLLEMPKKYSTNVKTQVG
jgi:hypothetical protein